VTPPTRQAATPVEAVTTVPSGGSSEPVPALPVKKTLLPEVQALSTCSCSSFKVFISAGSSGRFSILFSCLTDSGDGAYSCLADLGLSLAFPSINFRFFDAGGDGVVNVDFDSAVFLARSSSAFVTGEISSKPFDFSDSRCVRSFLCISSLVIPLLSSLSFVILMKSVFRKRINDPGGAFEMKTEAFSLLNLIVAFPSFMNFLNTLISFNFSFVVVIFSWEISRKISRISFLISFKIEFLY
jgi:hypothetical protein